MCEQCLDGWSDMPTMEVARVALMIGRINPFGAFHIVVEDYNLDDENIEFCLSEKDVTPMETVFGRNLLELTYDERLSSFAMSMHLWGAMPLRYPRAYPS